MVGQTISHYRVTQKLGTGGMGVVYRAHDERLQRSVALKLLSEEFSGSAERRARILAEARAAAALNHPGITTIYEVGEDGDQLFIVMELVSGKTLRALMAEKALEPRAQARLGAQIAEALAVAHAQGVVHGDIKPENAMMQADGRVKLLDFGIARHSAEDAVTATRGAAPPQPQDSHITGTLAYMAPEQLRGGRGEARSDLFSLGVVLYELAAGHRPFPGPTAAALMAQILHEAPAALSRVVPHAPPELARIAHKLLEKEPGSRYQSAREVQVDLNNLVRDLEFGPVLPAAITGKRAVAVLPFKLLTPNAEDEYLSVALADAVINQLGASGDLLVRPTTTVMRYTLQAPDPLLAARELNVQVIVDGSIQRVERRLRVHVQAWNSADGSTLLSGKFDAGMNNLFGLQDNISEALAGALGARNSESAVGPQTRPTANPVAYELYLRATERLSRWNRWDTAAAIEMLTNAARMDPRFAEAWARLAEARRQMGIHFDPGPRWLRQAERDIRRALDLAPDNADARCVQGRILFTPARRFQNRAALRALAKALDLNPNCHQAQVERGCILFHVGLHEEAKECLSRALATNPDDASVLAYLGQTAFYQGNYDEAERYKMLAYRVDPAHMWVNLFGPESSVYGNQLSRAEEEIRAAMRLFPDDPMLKSYEALLWAKRGDARKAVQLVKQAMRSGTSLVHTHHTLHNLAAACAVLGKRREAVALLQRAGGTGLPNYPLFRDDPHLQPLRGYAPYLRLLANLKKEWEKYRREFGG